MQFEEELTRRLADLGAQGLYRRLRRIDSSAGSRVQVEGRTLLNFSSNDYLGLAQHPALAEAILRAVTDYGAGSGASRLICGSLGLHHQLEEALAEYQDLPAALVFSSGYAAAAGTVPALVGPGDVVIIDKLVHACVVDAARLSGARLRVFGHNDLDDLERILRWADQRRASDRAGRGKPAAILIVTESVFSMDGDAAPLREMVTLKDRFGAWLMVDEAHATGFYGSHRRGRIEEEGLNRQVEIHMGTLGKALGCAGGYVAGSRALIDFLINRARSFIFSTAPVPAASAAAMEAVRIVRSSEGQDRARRLWTAVDQTRTGLRERGLDPPANRSAIVPVMVGDETRAVNTAAELGERGILLPAIRYPTVARGRARLRLTLGARHTVEDIDRLLVALAEMARPAPA